MQKATRAFTLIELVVVVSILVLLAGVLIPVVKNEMDKAMVGKSLTDMKVLSEAYNRYYVHTGYWPTKAKTETFATTTSFQFTTMPCLYTNVHTRKNWNGPYLNAGTMVNNSWQVATKTSNVWSGFVDPWGTPYELYQFAKNAQMGPFGGLAIISYGSNLKKETDITGVAKGTPAGDDLVTFITRSL